MRRNVFSTMFVAALVGAASIYAAPTTVAASTQYLSQIGEQASQIQSQADLLEQYARSGARDSSYAAGLAWQMAQSAQKLAGTLDQYAAQPGTTNVTRQQVERMKVDVAEIQAFIGGTIQNLDSQTMPLHTREVLGSINNIMDRGNLVRTAAQNLAGAN